MPWAVWMLWEREKKKETSANGFAWAAFGYRRPAQHDQGEAF